MTDKLTAKDVALYMIYRNKATFQNNLPSSIKLQKLVFFAYLNHWAKYNEPLFADEIKAYKNGCVVESLIDEYKGLFKNCNLEEKLTNFKNKTLPNLSKDQIDTLATTVDIYMDTSAKELSDLNHQMHCWKSKYKNCLKEDITINYEDLKDDITKAKDVLDIHEDTKNSNEIEFNGIKYFYEKDFVLTDEVIKELKEHSKDEHLDENAYGVCYMDGELVIY